MPLKVKFHEISRVKNQLRRKNISGRMSPAHSQIHQLAAKRLLEHPVLHSILSCQRSPCTDKNDKTCWMSKPGDCYNIATQTTHGCRETKRHRVAVEACVYRATGRCWTVPKIGQLPLKLAGIHSDFRFQGQPLKTNQSPWFLVLSALVWKGEDCMFSSSKQNNMFFWVYAETTTLSLFPFYNLLSFTMVYGKSTIQTKSLTIQTWWFRVKKNNLNRFCDPRSAMWLGSIILSRYNIKYP